MRVRRYIYESLRGHVAFGDRLPTALSSKTEEFAVMSWFVLVSYTSRRATLLLQHPDSFKVPNRAVDMDSWARSACYPRGNFYPLIFYSPTRNSRFTRTHFRVCAACTPCSQAGMCSCTLRAISIRAEPTFVRLRYNLGGIRPR